MITSQIDFSEAKLPKCEITTNKEIPKVVLLNLTELIFDRS
jgi:CxxC motif-containing protein